MTLRYTDPEGKAWTLKDVSRCHKPGHGSFIDATRLEDGVHVCVSTTGNHGLSLVPDNLPAIPPGSNDFQEVPPTC